MPLAPPFSKRRMLFLVAAACMVVQIRALVADTGFFQLFFLDLTIILCILLIIGIVIVAALPQRETIEAESLAAEEEE